MDRASQRQIDNRDIQRCKGRDTATGSRPADTGRQQRQAERWRQTRDKVNHGDVRRASAGEGRGPDGSGGSRPRRAKPPGVWGTAPHGGRTTGTDQGGICTYLRAAAERGGGAALPAAKGSGLDGGPGTQQRLLPAEAPPRPGPPPLTPPLSLPLNPFKPSPL